MNSNSFLRKGMVVLALLCSAGGASAGGFTIIEVGTKKTGMMTSVAKPDDLSGVFHNPAGIADLRGNRFLIYNGVAFVNAGARVKAWPGSENYVDKPVDDEGYFQGTIKPTRTFGIMPMIVGSTDFGWAQGPVWALSAYVPEFAGGFFPKAEPSRYVMIEGFLMSGATALTSAYRLPGSLSFLSLGASLGLRVFYQQGEAYQRFNLDDLGNGLDIYARRQGTDYRPLYNFGLTADLPRGLTVGMMFVGGTPVRIKGTITLSEPDDEIQPLLTSVDRSLALLKTYDMTNELRMPHGLAVGLSWRALDSLELAADYRHWFYSSFKEQRMYHNIDVALVPGKPLLASPMVTPKDYGDSWTVSAGALARPLKIPLDLMAGWTYDHSPVPDHTLTMEQPFVDLTGFSVGSRYRVNQDWRVSLTYYHYWYLRDQVDNSILDPPQNIIFQGTSDVVSFQLEYGI